MLMRCQVSTRMCFSLDELARLVDTYIVCVLGYFVEEM